MINKKIFNTLLVSALLLSGSAYSAPKKTRENYNPPPAIQTPNHNPSVGGSINLPNRSAEVHIQGSGGDYSGFAGAGANLNGGYNFSMFFNRRFREEVREIIREELGLNE